jgi:hypothetical protein
LVGVDRGEATAVKVTGPTMAAPDNGDAAKSRRRAYTDMPPDVVTDFLSGNGRRHARHGEGLRVTNGQPNAPGVLETVFEENKAYLEANGIA